MNYNKLKTKSFIKKGFKQKITKEILKSALKDAYINTRFSTFPYHFYKLNSREAINKFKEGNCIALSMYIQNYLKKRGIKSYLIPATIPYFIQHPDLLDISHVALAIPKNKDNTFIIDVAFYFLEPLHIKHNKKENKKINIMNFNDNGIEKINSFNTELKKKLIYNKYQSLPKNTKIVNCYNNKKKNIKWEYLLRNIINPDEAISSFFLQVRKNPFFLETGYKNNRCTMKTSLNFYNNNKDILIKNNNKEIYFGNLQNFFKSNKEYLKNIFKKYK